MSVLVHPYIKKAKKNKVFDNVNNAQDLYDLFDKTYKETENSDEFGKNQMELVSEAMVKFYNLYKDYAPGIGPDEGLDAKAKDKTLGHKVVFQIKAKLQRNHHKAVSSDELSKAIKEALHEGVTDPSHVVFIVLCKPNKKLVKRGYRFIAKTQIEKYLNNPAFWTQFRLWINNEKPKEIVDKKHLLPQQQKFIDTMSHSNINYNQIDVGAGKSLTMLRRNEQLIHDNKLKRSCMLWGTTNRALAEQVYWDIIFDRRENFDVLIVDSGNDVDLDGEIVDLVDGFEIPDESHHTEDLDEIKAFYDKPGHKIIIVCYPSSSKIKNLKFNLKVADEYQGLCGRYASKHKGKWQYVTWKQDFINARADDTHYVSGSAMIGNVYGDLHRHKDHKFRDYNHPDFGRQGVVYLPKDSIKDGLTVGMKTILYESNVDENDETEFNTFIDSKTVNHAMSDGTDVKLTGKGQKMSAIATSTIKDAMDHVRNEIGLDYEKSIGFSPRISHSKWVCDPTNPYGYHSIFEGPILRVDGSIKGDEREKIFNEHRETNNGHLDNVYVVREGVDIPDTNILIAGRTFGNLGSLTQAMRHRRLHPVDRKNLAEGKIKISDAKGWRKPFGVTIVPMPKGYFNSQAQKRTNTAFDKFIEHLLLNGPLYDIIMTLVNKSEKEGKVPNLSSTIKTKSIQFPNTDQKTIEKYIKRVVIDTVHKHVIPKINNKNAGNILREYRKFADNETNYAKPEYCKRGLIGKVSWKKQMMKKYKVMEHFVDCVVQLHAGLVSETQIKIHQDWRTQREQRLHPSTGQNADCVRTVIQMLKHNPLVSESQFEKLQIAVNKKDKDFYNAKLCKVGNMKGKYVTYPKKFLSAKHRVSEELATVFLCVNLKHPDYHSKLSSNKNSSIDVLAKEHEKTFCQYVDKKLLKEIVKLKKVNYKKRRQEVLAVQKSMLKLLTPMKQKADLSNGWKTTLKKQFPFLARGDNANSIMTNFKDPMLDTKLIKLCKKITTGLKEGHENLIPAVLSAYPKVFNKQHPKRKLRDRRWKEKNSVETTIMKKFNINQHLLTSIIENNVPDKKGKNPKTYGCTNIKVKQTFNNWCKSKFAEEKNILANEEKQILQKLEKIRKQKEDLDAA